MTTPPNKSTGDDVSIINLSPYRYVFTHMGETRTYVKEQDYLAAEARAVAANDQLLETLKREHALLIQRDALQAQVDALTKERDNLAECYGRRLHELKAADARAAEYMQMRNEAMAVAEDNKGHLQTAFYRIREYEAQADALTKRSEVVESMALAPGMKTNLALQADLAAATARYERYEKALRKLYIAQMNDAGPHQFKEAMDAARDALAEQALADSPDGANPGGVYGP